MKIIHNPDIDKDKPPESISWMENKQTIENIMTPRKAKRLLEKKATSKKNIDSPKKPRETITGLKCIRYSVIIK